MVIENIIEAGVRVFKEEQGTIYSEAAGVNLAADSAEAIAQAPRQAISSARASALRPCRNHH